PRRTVAECFNLAREVQRAAKNGVVERLLPQSIPCEKQFPGRLMIDGKGEHAFEEVDAAGAVLLERMDDRLGIAARAEDVALGNQLFPQLVVVVDLAVEDDPAVAG